MMTTSDGITSITSSSYQARNLTFHGRILTNSLELEHSQKRHHCIPTVDNAKGVRPKAVGR